MFDHHFGHNGNAAGWLLQISGAALTFVTDHGAGLALMLFGAWIQWQTLQLRRLETEARIKALAKTPGAP